MEPPLSKAGRRVAHIARALAASGTLFKKLLVVNRGEIACRLFRASKALGIPTVAIFAAADKDALHIEVILLLSHLTFVESSERTLPPSARLRRATIHYSSTRPS